MQKGHKLTFDKTRYADVKAGLQEFRLDSYIRTIEKRKGKNKGTILPFVRGLRFAALLIYSIRKIIRPDLEASWGHLINDEGELSRECDIVIHKKGHYMRWNGDGEYNVMDFRFIEIDKAIAVISCKSMLYPSTIETDYCSDLDSFSKDVWLFAECCGPDSVDDIKAAAATHGYKKFWHLYTWNRKDDSVIDALDSWYDFTETIRAL